MLIRLCTALKALLHWAPWACLYEDDPLAGALPSSLAMCLQAQGAIASPEDDGWGRLAAATRALFSRQPERRQQASHTLRALLGMTPSRGGGPASDGEEPHLGKPWA